MAADPRSSVGALLLPAPVLLRVRGADRVSFLHRLLSCDLRALAPGTGTAGLLLTAKGKVTADFTLFLLPDRVEMIAAAEARPGLQAGLAKFVIADDVALEDRFGAEGAVTLVGRRAAAAAARVLGAALPDAPGPAAVEGAVAGVPVTAFLHARAGLPAVDLVAAAASLGAVRAAAEAAAAAEGGGAIAPEALEVLRIENGVPRLGAESGAETLPQEAGLEGLVSFTKGCFLGQEPVARLRTRGHTNRGLAGVVLAAGAAVPAAGDPLLLEGREVGSVTSAAFSAALRRPVALCLLRHEAAAAGTRLDLRTGGGVLSCEVAPLPFVQGG